MQLSDSDLENANKNQSGPHVFPWQYVGSNYYNKNKCVWGMHVC